GLDGPYRAVPEGTASLTVRNPRSRSRYPVFKDRLGFGLSRSEVRSLAWLACRCQELVGLERFELSTPRLSSVCSNQLSYRPLLHSLPLRSLRSCRPSRW